MDEARAASPDDNNGKPLRFCYRYQDERPVAGRPVTAQSSRNCTTPCLPRKSGVEAVPSRAGSHARYLRLTLPLGEHVRMSPSDDDTVFSNEERSGVQADLRQRISAALLHRIDAITADTVEIFPFSGTETLDHDCCLSVGGLLVNLLAFSVRDARLDPTGAFVANLHRIVLERRLSTERLFTFAYLIERTVLDELALDEVIGAMTESWPVVAQLVSRGSFDVLAAYTERALLEPAENCLVDPLTTLYTRPMLEAVLAKEVERAGRFGELLSLILFDVDRLSTINEEHGYGVGDKILERLGILIGKYFRHYDWVARYSDDSIAVLLTHADADHASDPPNAPATPSKSGWVRRPPHG